MPPDAPSPAQLASRFAPGQSGNPSGRPKGFRGVAARILRETGDGEELVSFALDTLRNTTGQRSHAERWEALCWLADRGIGRPVAMVELAAQLTSGDATDTAPLDTALERLQVPELERLLTGTGLFALLGLGGPAAQPVIEAAAVERPALVAGDGGEAP